MIKIYIYYNNLFNMTTYNLLSNSPCKNNLSLLLETHIQLNAEIDELNAEINELLNSDTTYLVKLLIDNNIHKSWYNLFIKQSNILINTMKNLDLSRQQYVIYPPHELVFKVFEALDIEFWREQHPITSYQQTLSFFI